MCKFKHRAKRHLDRERIKTEIVLPALANIDEELSRLCENIMSAIENPDKADRMALEGILLCGSVTNSLYQKLKSWIMFK